MKGHPYLLLSFDILTLSMLILTYKKSIIVNNHENETMNIDRSTSTSKGIFRHEK